MPGPDNLSRRGAVQRIGAALLAGAAQAAGEGLQIAGQTAEVQIAPVSAHTVRLSVLPVKDGKAAAVVGDGTLVRENWGPPAATFREAAGSRTVKLGSMGIQV